MKNKFIAQKLNSYVEEVRPQRGVLDRALYEMRRFRTEEPGRTERQRRAGEYRQSARTAGERRPAFAGIAAVLLVIGVISYFIITNLPRSAPGPAQSYHISELTYKNVPAGEIGSSVLTMDTENVYVNAREYYAGNASVPVLISVLYKTVGDGGLDEVVVLADLAGGLEDYKDFQSLGRTDIKGTAVFMRQQWINGEYYADAYFRYGDVDYYIMTESALSGAVQRYIARLIS